MNSKFNTIKKMQSRVPATWKQLPGNKDGNPGNLRKHLLVKGFMGQVFKMEIASNSNSFINHFVYKGPTCM